jgi:hypothetical protein
LLPSSFKANKLRSNIAQLTPWFGSIFVVDQYIQKASLGTGEHISVHMFAGRKWQRIVARQ